MLPDKVQEYLLHDLEATPDVFDALLESVPAMVYDRRPDPERFTLREVLAHLADWEDVFRGRLIQTRDQENATLIGLDEGQIALDHDYAHADPAESLARFRQGRGKSLALLHSLTPAQWDRTGQNTEIGPITLAEQVVLIAGHDGYHLQQVAQWLRE